MENRTCELNNPGFEVEGHRSGSSTTERALVLKQHAPSEPVAGGGQCEAQIMPNAHQAVGAFHPPQLPACGEISERGCSFRLVSARPSSHWQLLAFKRINKRPDASVARCTSMQGSGTWGSPLLHLIWMRQRPAPYGSLSPMSTAATGFHTQGPSAHGLLCALAARR